ncbi:MAG: hypothetical protein P9M05_09320 [Candidatus Stygibacter australis]|nr:hypothetical protein [Candidatus Stygibacter australis]
MDRVDGVNGIQGVHLLSWDDPVHDLPKSAPHLRVRQRCTCF